jgi:hypothetical protein
MLVQANFENSRVFTFQLDTARIIKEIVLPNGQPYSRAE